MFRPKVRGERVSRLCSKDCRTAASTRRREVQCAECGNAFEVQVGRPAKFCSVACRAASTKKTEPKTCAVCGARFDRTRLPSGRLESPANWEERTTCSRVCGSKQQGLTLKASNDDPWVVGERRLVARSCESCGGLLPAAAFRELKAAYLSHQCTACRAAQKAALEHEQWRQTVARATRYGAAWTGPELEIAARPDLTAMDAALMLGRTVKAVRHARSRVRNEPKWAMVAGLSSA